MQSSAQWLLTQRPGLTEQRVILDLRESGARFSQGGTRNVDSAAVSDLARGLSMSAAMRDDALDCADERAQAGQPVCRLTRGGLFARLYAPKQLGDSASAVVTFDATHGAGMVGEARVVSLARAGERWVVRQARLMGQPQLPCCRTAGVCSCDDLSALTYL